VLDQAGLASGVPAASTGTLTVNGASISYDTSVDSLTSIITKINSSSAGVIASLDRGSDKLIITSKTGGATPITIQDSGPLAAALNLHPDSTAGQVLGQQASITIDGRTYTSDTDTFSNALDGIKINVVAKGSSTLTITPDTGTTSKAAQDVVDAYNALADALDTMTANGVNQTKGALAGNASVRNLSLSLRSIVTGFASSGSFTSLADLGISTGAVGSKVGTTDRLVLDSTKLTDAIATDSSAVAKLFSNVMGSLNTSIKSWTDFGKSIDSAKNDITSTLSQLDTREADVNQRVATRQAALEAQFAKMESLLAQMQTTTNSLTNTVSQFNKNTG
jgi:flagellar hook-associated protein 2